MPTQVLDLLSFDLRLTLVTLIDLLKRADSLFKLKEGECLNDLLDCEAITLSNKIAEKARGIIFDESVLGNVRNVGGESLLTVVASELGFKTMVHPVRDRTDVLLIRIGKGFVMVTDHAEEEKGGGIDVNL